MSVAQLVKKGRAYEKEFHKVGFRRDKFAIRRGGSPPVYVFSSKRYIHVTFEPIFKSIIWGGEKIAPFKGVKTSQKKLAKAGKYQVGVLESIVADGPTVGSDPPQLVERQVY